ncbi:DUF2066 domain-containing protein [Arenimonas donghaensis]|uniref:DUF2066 domain-containing protein n=1 Tax=Arenimonas donghaensis DSM 18148 = HO3-R19 TaxID=1121014 RepID=A0A087MJJ0_9GAMM|nr:DUF2066 domain-containing protein [Arenimonas donghaensis]KFL37043.1 hypothetical protein N788_11580 [Arenimonas donghaensis DSM 18148 = HO3-R19]
MRPRLHIRLFVVLLALAAAPWVAAQSPAPVAAAESGEPGLVAEADTPRDMALYTGESELLSQDAGERRAATARALAQVLVKLTGEPLASANPVVRRALPKAASFVMQEQTADSVSDQQGNTAIGGAPVYKTTLRVQFDPNKVDALIVGAGLPYWGPDRPSPILWLAIDDGRGARLVNAGQINVVKPLASRGTERGLSFGLPTGSAVEQAAVDTLWARNPGPIQALTERYGHQTQLLGRLYREGQGWTADWVLSSGGSELSRWSFSDPSPQRALASGADGAADAIARRDATRAAVGEPGVHVVRISGLRLADDFTRAMGYLQTLPVVRELTVLEATPDSLQLRLDLAVGLSSFDGFLAAGDVLEAQAPAATASPDPAGLSGEPTEARYRLRP